MKRFSESVIEGGDVVVCVRRRGDTVHGHTEWGTLWMVNMKKTPAIVFFDRKYLLDARSETPDAELYLLINYVFRFSQSRTTVRAEPLTENRHVVMCTHLDTHNNVV